MWQDAKQLQIGRKWQNLVEARTQVPAAGRFYVNMLRPFKPAAESKPRRAFQAIPSPPSAPTSRPSGPCFWGKLRQATCLWGQPFLSPHPSRSRAAPPAIKSTCNSRQGEDGEGNESKQSLEASRFCHTQDGGAATASSLRGGTSACAARSPGPGHKMAAAALGRARRRRQNGRSSRTCNRVPSSPLREGKSPKEPWSRSKSSRGPGIPNRAAAAPPACCARGCRLLRSLLPPPS